MSDAPSHHWSTDFHPAQHLCHNNRLKSELHDKLKETYVMHVTLIRSKQRKTIKQTIHLITTLKFHMNLKDDMFFSIQWYFIADTLHVSDVWDDTRVAGRAGILRYLCVFVPWWCRGAALGDTWQKSRCFYTFSIRPNSPLPSDFGALLKDINTHKEESPASLVFCHSRTFVWHSSTCAA